MSPGPALGATAGVELLGAVTLGETSSTEVGGTRLLGVPVDGGLVALAVPVCCCFNDSAFVCAGLSAAATAATAKTADALSPSTRFEFTVCFGPVQFPNGVVRDLRGYLLISLLFTRSTNEVPPGISLVRWIRQAMATLHSGRFSLQSQLLQEQLMVLSLRRATVVLGVSAALVGAGSATGATAAGPASGAGKTGSVYLLQGISDASVAVSVDGQVVAPAAAAKKIIGPLNLPAGTHTVSVVGKSADTSVTSKITVTAGGSTDAIAHRQVDPSAPPVITTYENDLRPVGAGKGRLVVAHTAAVGPADVLVDGKVLFANIASGENLTLEVPAKTYPVSIVPAATTGPTVLGPVQLPVAAKSLTRVFAIGVAESGTMDAIVQVLPLTTRGTGTTPGRVESGNGGAAQQRMEDRSGGIQRAGLLTGAGLLAAAGVVVTVRRRRARV